MLRNELYIWKLYIVAAIISYILDKGCSDVLILKHENTAINLLSVFMEIWVTAYFRHVKDRYYSYLLKKGEGTRKSLASFDILITDWLVWSSSVSITHWVFKHEDTIWKQAVWHGIESTSIRFRKLWFKFWLGHKEGMQHWALNILNMTFLTYERE